MQKWMNIQYLKLFSAFQVLVRTKILCTHFSTSIANHPVRNSSFVHFFYIYFKKNPHFTFIPSCLFNQSKQKSTYACLFHPACLIKFDKNPPMHIYYIRSFIRYLRVNPDKRVYWNHLVFFIVTPINCISWLLYWNWSKIWR